MPSSTISLGLILVNFCVRCWDSRFFLSIADHIIYNLCQKLFTIQAALYTPYFHQNNLQSTKSIPLLKCCSCHSHCIIATAWIFIWSVLHFANQRVLSWEYHSRYRHYLKWQNGQPCQISWWICLRNAFFFDIFCLA
jgi:hypothetical protein